MTTRRLPPSPVERPAHVHPTRMRHISDADLAAALARPGASVSQLRAEFAARPPVRPVWDPAAQAAAMPARARAAELSAAAALAERPVDFLGRGLGRSQLYGLHYLTWARPLVVAYELTGDDAFATSFDRVFAQWYAGRDDVVGDWPGLDVIWYSLGVWARSATIVSALAAFTGAAGLRDPTWAAMVKTLVGGTRWAAEEHDEFRPGNWQLVCAAELLHVAAYLPDAPEARDWAAVGRARTLEHLERDFYADGGHHERSPGYHALCLEALQRAAVVSEQHLGWRLADHRGFRAAHHWLAELATPEGWVPPWQDSSTVYPGVLLLRGGQLLDDAALRSAASRWLSAEQLGSELAVLPPATGRSESSAGAAPDVDTDPPGARSRLLAGSGYAVLRGSAPAHAYLAVNVGPYVEHELESHSHLAVTDFVAGAYGAALALDPGGPPTYDDPRYQDWYRVPLAHNVFAVAGEEMSTDRRCVVDELRDADPVTVLRVHHDGYSRRVHRRIVFVAADPVYWVVSDRVEGGGGATWSLLGQHRWLESDSGFRGAGAPCLHVLPATRPDGVRFDAGPGQVPGPAAAHYAELSALRLQVNDGRIDVLLAPDATGGDHWRVEATDEGLRVTGDEVVDLISADRWVRRDRAGTLVATASWDAGAPGAVHSWSAESVVV